MKPKFSYRLLWLLVFCVCVDLRLGYAGPDTTEVEESKLNIAYGKIIPELAKIAYSGGEKFKYDVSWTGGIKIGEIYLSLNDSRNCDDCVEIDSIITTSGGIVHALYPVKDRHVTQVRGQEKLPYFCEIWQKQGRNYTAHKIIRYDQQEFEILKQKTGSPDRRFKLAGKVHNEFSSFFSSRLMSLEIEKPILVPTFGDDKRNEVVVKTLKNEIIEETILGDVKTLKVSPILTFSGLYDKQGDTIIWYTDDECRVPVLIESKIVIGSLTATLAEYNNPNCERYQGKVK